MKRKFFIATLFVASMALSGITAYTVSKSTRGGSSGLNSEFTSSVGNHFTSYQQDSYPDLTYAAENAVKGVVNIEVRQTVAPRTMQGRGGGGMDPFLEFFGIPQGSFEQPQAPQERAGGGSGVIISPDGYIVTNNHVIDKADKIKVTLNDNRTFDAKLIGTDPTTDIALIKVEATDLPTIPFGNSDELRLGEWVLAIGSPFGLQSTVTAGIISAKARNLDIIPSQFRIESFIQTDAAVNPGNSGGALVNKNGQLVGINTVIKSPTGSFAGYSFAVPASIAKKVVVDLKEFGIVQRALLGVTYREINDAFIEELGKEKGIKEKTGVYVVSVDPEGAAAAAGIKEGDVIVEIEGAKVDGSSQVSAVISKYRPNDKIKVSVKRGSDLKLFEVVLRNRSGNTSIVKKETVAAYDALGGQFTDIPEKMKRELKIDHGVQVIAMDADGILAKSRVRRGYIITHINEHPIRSISDLNRLSEEISSIDGVYPDGKAASFAIVK